MQTGINFSLMPVYINLKEFINMKNIIKILFLILFLNSYLLPQSNIIYVDANNGSDVNPGTIDSPVKNISQALSIAGSNISTMFLRAGTYKITGSIKLNYSGEAGNYNQLLAYQGEKVIIDCSLLSPGSKGILLYKDYWHIKNLEIENAPHNGIYIEGSYNIIENCSIHNNGDTGLHITKGGYNLVLNCDSYFNYDPAKHGENADGFGVKYHIGGGNVFKGCRAFNNSDDGWDLWMADSTVTIDSCFAFRNGINSLNDAAWQGDGNGFKLGGYYIAAPHVVKNCISFDNFSTGRGFDENNNMAGQTIYNCTSFRNKGDNFHFTNNIAPLNHVIKNCISFQGGVNLTNTIQENNSWQGFTVSDTDFLSIDTALALAPRNRDGSLPSNNFFRLASSSNFIDAGVDVGIAYSGKAPDLGAFESAYTIEGTNIEREAPEHFELQQNYPNPFNPSTVIGFFLPNESKVLLAVYNVLGQEKAVLINDVIKEGSHKVRFNASGFPGGVYFYKIKTGKNSAAKKMLLMK